LDNAKQKSNRVKKESELEYKLSQCFLSSYIDVPQEQFLSTYCTLNDFQLFSEAVLANIEQK
jgi:hypothetical protein